MTPERWRQITETFHAARERDPARREAFIAEACRDDPTLRREVEAMLAGLNDAGKFGETPLFASASRPEPASPLDVIQLAPGSQLGPYQILTSSKSTHTSTPCARKPNSSGWSLTSSTSTLP
jgi:hypothetical protein